MFFFLAKNDYIFPPRKYFIEQSFNIPWTVTLLYVVATMNMQYYSCMALISRWRDMLPTEASTAINIETGVIRYSMYGR